MGNVYKPIDQALRLVTEYLEARSLFEEKREAMARVVEIDRTLRELSSEDPEAVEAARAKVPFRKPQGRQKSEEKSGPIICSE